MYIKIFDGAAVIISEERDRTCSNPQGHDFNPESGAPFGHNGNCCVHCGHFVGRHEEMRDTAEAQAYAQAMLGANGPVEVREIEWKWGPGGVRKSPLILARPGAIDIPVVALWEKDVELLGFAAAPDPLAALERLLGDTGDMRDDMTCAHCGRDYSGDEDKDPCGECESDDCPANIARYLWRILDGEGWEVE